MGHEDVNMILSVYTDLDKRHEASDSARLKEFMVYD